MKLLRHTNTWNYDPFVAVDSLFKNIINDRSISRYYGEPVRSEFLMDTYSDDNAYHLVAELPGFKKEDIDVRLERNRLVIEVSQEPDTEEETRSVLAKREVQLGNGIDTNKISASMEDGLLKIILPKAAEEAKKVITIQ